MPCAGFQGKTAAQRRCPQLRPLSTSGSYERRTLKKFTSISEQVVDAKIIPEVLVLFFSIDVTEIILTCIFCWLDENSTNTNHNIRQMDLPRLTKTWTMSSLPHETFSSHHAVSRIQIENILMVPYPSCAVKLRLESGLVIGAGRSIHLPCLYLKCHISGIDNDGR